MTAIRIERLIQMLNHIAQNMAANGGEDEVAEQVAQHIAKFWSLSMKKPIIEHLTTSDSRLLPIAKRALSRLQQQP